MEWPSPLIFVSSTCMDWKMPCAIYAQYLNLPQHIILLHTCVQLYNKIIGWCPSQTVILSNPQKRFAGLVINSFGIKLISSLQFFFVFEFPKYSPKNFLSIG